MPFSVFSYSNTGGVCGPPSKGSHTFPGRGGDRPALPVQAGCWRPGGASHLVQGDARCHQGADHHRTPVKRTDRSAFSVAFHLKALLFRSWSIHSQDPRLKCVSLRIALPHSLAEESLLLKHSLSKLFFFWYCKLICPFQLTPPCTHCTNRA